MAGPALRALVATRAGRRPAGRGRSGPGPDRRLGRRSGGDAAVAEAALAEARDPELRARLLLRMATDSADRPATARAEARRCRRRGTARHDATERPIRTCWPAPCCSRRRSASRPGSPTTRPRSRRRSRCWPTSRGPTGDSDAQAESFRAHALVWEWADDHDRLDEALAGAQRDLARARDQWPRPAAAHRRDRGGPAAGPGRATGTRPPSTPRRLEAAELAAIPRAGGPPWAGWPWSPRSAATWRQRTGLAGRCHRAGSADDWLDGPPCGPSPGRYALARGDAPRRGRDPRSVLDEQRRPRAWARPCSPALRRRSRRGGRRQRATSRGRGRRSRCSTRRPDRDPGRGSGVVAARGRGPARGRRRRPRGAAESPSRTALEPWPRCRCPLERARTELAAGRIARRRKERRRAARAPRARRRRASATLGAAAWLAIAEAEVARLGRRGGGADTLTETEAQVARLAAAGLTNREVGEAAFLTAKSVEGVLARVYQKLGIRSRAELGAWLAGPPGDDGGTSRPGIPRFGSGRAGT